MERRSYYRCKGCYRDFLHSISPPHAIDTKKIEASLENGFLEAILTKIAEVKLEKLISAKRMYSSMPCCASHAIIEKRREKPQASKSKSTACRPDLTVKQPTFSCRQTDTHIGRSINL